MLWELGQRLRYTWKFRRRLILGYVAMFAVILLVIVLWIASGASDRL
jgi:hypothetical protein